MWVVVGGWCIACCGWLAGVVEGQPVGGAPHTTIYCGNNGRPTTVILASYTRPHQPTPSGASLFRKV